LALAGFGSIVRAMSGFQLAVDVSNYSGAISQEQAACLKARGVEHLIAGTQVPSVTRAQLEAALTAGMSIDAYVYLYWRRDIRAEVARALETVSGLPAGRLWLDCEDGAGGLPGEDIVAVIAGAVEACGDSPCGVYTGRWWWAPSTGDSGRFSHLPLWHAEYTRSAEERPDFDSFRPYGGWTRPAMWQFRGTTSLCGVSVDLNLRQVPSMEQAGLNERDRIELALLRAGQCFDRARALGHYVFRPDPANPARVELQAVEAGRAVSFEPPYLIRVD